MKQLNESFRKRKSVNKSRRRRSRKRSSSYQTLESRNLLAGIFFESGEIIFGGSEGNDTAGVSISGSTITASLTGFPNRTFSSSEVSSISFTGLAGDDRFTNGTSLPSFAYGLDGDDTLIGGFGADTLVGGRGSDTITGRAGDDTLRGGIAPGTDVLSGGDGNDRIFGGTGTNEIRGGNGDDLIFSSDQPDQVWGDNGNDLIYPGHGANVVFGGNGDDLINTGRGNDTISGGNGNDRIYAVGGDDRIDGGAGDDALIGGDGNDIINGEAGNDLVRGLNGNDIITGGDSTTRNRLYGDNGNDRITGGNQVDFVDAGEGVDTINTNAGNDIVLAGGGDDIINGGDGNDFVFGGDGDDNFVGGNGNDEFWGQRGNDTFNGGSGTDRSSYGRNFQFYRITGTSPLFVTDTGETEGTDRLINAEKLRFNDGVRDAVSEIEERVLIQPIIVSNTNGSNTAKFFGNATQEAEIKRLIDETFYQARVDLVWRSAQTWNNTFANIGRGGTRPVEDLTTIKDNGIAAGVASADPLTINLYLVEVAPGTNDATVSENSVNGIAFINNNGVTLHIGDNLIDFEEGRKSIARVTAHEIAHNFGLTHVADTKNLLTSGSVTNDKLTPAQSATIIDSRFSS
jgi:hypothetical protein